MKNISVFGFATFGHPSGFTQSVLYGNKNLEKKVDTFDLKTDAILLLSPKDRIYSIRKEVIQQIPIISYSVYTFAKEQNSNRSGTFIGTSILFENEIATENLTVNALHDLHANLKNNNVSSDFELLVKNSGEFNLDNLLQKDFEKLQFQLRSISGKNWQNITKNLVIYSPNLEVNAIQNLFKKSLELIPDFYTVYFIDSKEVAEFVTKRKLFKIIYAENIEQEIQNLANERRRKVQEAIVKIEKEKEKTFSEMKTSSDRLQKAIAESENKHSANRKIIDGSLDVLKLLNKSFTDHIQNLDSFILALKNNSSIDAVQKSAEETKKKFEQKKKSFSASPSLQPVISQPQNRIPIRENSNNYNEERRNNEPKPYKLHGLKLASIVLNVLLAAGLLYLLFFKSAAASGNNIPQIAAGNSGNDSLNQQTHLNPVPNDVLAEEDYKILAKKLNNTMSIDSLVALIYAQNPEKVGEIYLHQKEDYAKQLQERNPNSFQLNDEKKLMFSGKDSIKNIPSFDWFLSK